MLQPQADRFALARRPAAFFFVMIMAAFLLLASLSQPAASQTYKVIYNFTGQGKDGATPYAGPALGQGGILYGTTNLGGTYGSGSVYKLSPNGSSWKYSSLHSFAGQADGAGPGFGTLALHQGAFFGTTEGGGDFGTAFKVGPCKNGCPEIVVHSFGQGTDGAEPVGGVVFDEHGNFYGTTLMGGTNNNGTVFKVTPAGAEKVIYNFRTGKDAANPSAAVTVDAEGNLYGTAPAGGAYGNGAVFKLTHSASGWRESVLHSFHGPTDGANPVGGVILDKAGNVYGGTFDGGVNGGGTVYKLSPSGGGWKFTILYSFTGGYSGPYNKLTFDAKGNLYGILNGGNASNLGSVFKLTPRKGSWKYTDLHDFAGGSDGGLPYCQVAVDAQGNIFGTAVVGGSDNQGVVFEITP